jgi:hypothetical protein
LILLDTCRVDALREVKSEYNFIRDVESMWSVGGRTPEWIARTFDQDHEAEISQTAYLCANNFVVPILENQRQASNDAHLKLKSLRLMPTVDLSDLGKIEYLFEFEPPGESGLLGHEQGNTPPRYVTDRAIDVGRDNNYNRIILHYFQPHSPWVANAIKEDRALNQYEDDWWGYLTETGDKETVWKAYLDDLRYVLDDIELLLNNLDAETVAISADHGEAFGEYGSMGHKTGSLHPKVRKVPWTVTSGEDTHSYTPTIEESVSSEMSREELDQQLEALGYTM